MFPLFSWIYGILGLKGTLEVMFEVLHFRKSRVKDCVAGYQVDAFMFPLSPGAEHIALLCYFTVFTSLFLFNLFLIPPNEDLSFPLKTLLLSFVSDIFLPAELFLHSGYYLSSRSRLSNIGATSHMWLFKF